MGLCKSAHVLDSYTFTQTLSLSSEDEVEEDVHEFDSKRDIIGANHRLDSVYGSVR